MVKCSVRLCRRRVGSVVLDISYDLTEKPLPCSNYAVINSHLTGFYRVFIVKYVESVK